MELSTLRDKKVLVLGFGREGIDTFKFLRKMFPKKVLGIADVRKIKNDKKVRWHLGDNYLKSLKDYDVIIKSPGIPIHLPEVERAYKQGKITSQTEIFLKNFKGKVIGITGTKGKGTTASLIYEILKTAGLKVHLGGNIEKPVLKYLLKSGSNDIFVYEMSSHQLYSIRSSPQIAVLLNISPAHLDYYKNFKEYITTKANITKYQKNTDFLIYNSDDKIIREIAKKSKACKIPITTKDAIRFFKNYKLPCGKPQGISCGASLFPNRLHPCDKPQGIQPLENKKIPRKGFNFMNMASAIAVGKIFKIPPQKIIKAIKEFRGLPHRLEFFGNYRGILFYDDSAATVPEATIFALKTLGNRVQTIILGGYENKVSFKELARNILNSEIKNLIFFPPAGERIWKAIQLVPHQTRSDAGLAQGKKLPKSFFVNNMRDAVRISYDNTAKGKICLLSCAAPSFGIFKNYKHRGNLFKKYVKLFAK